MSGRWTQWAWLGLFAGAAVACFITVVLAHFAKEYDKATFNLLLGAANVWAARDKRDELVAEYKRRLAATPNGGQR